MITPLRHRPRTLHVDANGAPRFTNHLLGQTSPYLLQHLHNPVDWWPWGDAAFAEARRRDVPVFLSVGYATCHWCHVMEEESFDDVDMAALLNDNFVCIKVDREERPDVDAVYMAALQALSGRGGWPMNVWLTPNTRQPFYAGTYFPPVDGQRGARPGFATVINHLANTWQQRRAQVLQSAAELTAAVTAELSSTTVGEAPGLAVVDALVARTAERFDKLHGGQQGEPKFASQTPLRALFRHSARTGHAAGREMALHTLRKMMAGGVFDQLGGGFHRYSVDERWLVPHFEKMLYDNALLVPALLDAWQLTHDAVFEQAARRTLGFMRDVLADVDGTFFAATDADSTTPSGTREEGFFFTWTPAEVHTELQAAGFVEDDIVFVCAAFDITAAGNFEELHRSIPWHKEPLSSLARRLKRDLVDVEALLERARAALHRARRERPTPHVDTKVIAAHNGMAIAAFARAAFVFDDSSLLQHARSAWAAGAKRLQDVHGRLWRVRDRATGQGSAGLLDDHAWWCRAALELFDATGERSFLDDAIACDAVLAKHFEDERGGFFVSASDGEVLLAREKPDRDGAEPSGNSIHAENLVRLALLTDNDAYRARADKTMKAFGRLLAKAPWALAEMTAAIELDEAGREIVVVVPDVIDDDGRQLLQVLRQRYIPSRVLVWSRGAIDDSIALPLQQRRGAVDGKVTVYVCEGGACQLPVTTSRGLLEVLSRRV
jgi:uncharacterized protein YyaL (SSP411 family)